jgi:hypothetical protein
MEKYDTFLGFKTVYIALACMQNFTGFSNLTETGGCRERNNGKRIDGSAFRICRR